MENLSCYGLDVGYHYTKDSQRNIFQSAYTTKKQYAKEPIYIDGTEYYVGKGNMSGVVDKTQSELNKACTIYALLKTSRIQNVDLTVGLPIGQYESQKEKLRQSIYEYNNSIIEFNHKRINLSISNVNVIPQGIAAIYTLKELPYGRIIIVDIGGLTVCITSLKISENGEIDIEDSDTYYCGIRLFLDDVIKVTNEKYSLMLDNSFAEDIIADGLEINGVKQDTLYIKSMQKEYINNIINKICLKYRTDIIPTMVCGGGAINLGEILKRRIPNLFITPDPQFANAFGYYAYGCIKYNQRRTK